MRKTVPIIAATLLALGSMAGPGMAHEDRRRYRDTATCSSTGR
jgi:hypothetical protein